VRRAAAARGLSTDVAPEHRRRAKPRRERAPRAIYPAGMDRAPNALAAASPDVRRLDFSRGGLGARAYSVAVDEADRRVDDNLLALFDPIGYFHLRA
jgi:hypothetical protein